MRGQSVTQQTQDIAVEEFITGIAALTDVWMSMMWIGTANPRLNTTRREIARWARNANQSFIDTFGRATASEEIRVILDGLVTSVPKQLGDTGRDFLRSLTAEAQALADEGRAAVAAI
jgi:hypothetical protein